MEGMTAVEFESPHLDQSIQAERPGHLRERSAEHTAGGHSGYCYDHPMPLEARKVIACRVR
jgi:hypothetical protein